MSALSALRDARLATVAAADLQRRWRVTVEMLQGEIEAHPHDAHFRLTLRVAKRRLADAEAVVAAADEALAAAAERHAAAAMWDHEPTQIVPSPLNRVPRERGCECQWEAGDSPCRVHGAES